MTDLDMQSYGTIAPGYRRLHTGGAPMHDTSFQNWTLSKWLAAKTHDARGALIAAIHALDLSLSSDNGVRLLIAHDNFRRLVGPAYRDPILHSMLNEFFSGRTCTEIQKPSIVAESAYTNYFGTHRFLPQGLMPRMGWLYISEFVDLGLAQLTKTVQICEEPRLVGFEERFEGWQRLKNGIDRLTLSESDEEKLAIGALIAIQTYCKQLQNIKTSGSIAGQ